VTETAVKSEADDPAGKKGTARGRGKPANRQDFKIKKLYAGNVDFQVPHQIVTALQHAADVDAALSRYVPPPGFGTTVDRLRDEHVVVIEGRSGLGRYTSALALLREVAPGDVTPISPTTTLAELRTCEFAEGRGYYVPEHTARETGAEAEFHWNAVRGAVRSAKAFLVITTSDAAKYVKAVPWHRPDLDRILRAVLSDDADGLPAEFRHRIPEDWTPTDIVALGHRMRAKASPEEALGVFDLTATAEVEEWFREEHEWADFVEIAALSFAGSASPRAFESMVVDLENATEGFLPSTERSDEEKERAVARALSRRRRRNPLIMEERVTQRGIRRQILVFKSASHRRQVLHALWRTQAVPFWDGVQDWVFDLIADGDLDEDQLIQVAQALVLLAEENVEETIDSYLIPLAAGEAGEAGLDCASLVLRLMSLEDALAPTALQVVVGWASGSLWERLIGAEALMTELGVRYPAEAAKRLWQLIAQDDLLKHVAFETPGVLLQLMLDLDGDPMPVLELLAAQLDRLGKPRVAMRTVDLVLTTTLHLLTLKDDRNGRLVSFDFLLKKPETAEQFGRLWAGVLRNLRYRTKALGAIWDGMLAAQDRDALAAAFTGALTAVLTPAEQNRFLSDFTVIDSRKRLRDPQRTASLAHLFIDAVARIHDQTQTEKP